MFHSSKKKMCFTAQVLIMLLFLSIMGCGHDSKSEQNVDPADVYKGKTSIATVSSDNAEDLTMGGYFGGQLGTIISGDSKASQGGIKKNFRLLQIVQSIKQSTMGMEISKNEGQSKAVARQVNHVENGSDGGAASYVMDVNDSTGNFSGSATYANYSSDGVILNGSATITGTLDIDTEIISDMTLTFNALIINFGDPSRATLTGTLSWDNNYETDTDTMTMNITLLDQEDGKTYWFNSYEITTNYETDSLSGFFQTITGRFYDHDYGYVNISTPIPLFTYVPLISDADGWDPLGMLLFSGDSGTWTRLVFDEEICLIEADTNGDHIIDWELEIDPNE